MSEPIWHNADDIRQIGELTDALTVLRSRVEEQSEEIERMSSDYERLACSMEYHGNSVQWWHSKANAYKSALGKAWDNLKKCGVYPTGEIDVADAIIILGSKVADLERENEKLEQAWLSKHKRWNKAVSNTQRAVYESILDALADLAAKQTLQVFRKGIIKAMTRVRQEMEKGGRNE